MRTDDTKLVRIARKLSEVEPKGSKAKLSERGANPRRASSPANKKESWKGSFLLACAKGDELATGCFKSAVYLNCFNIGEKEIKLWYTLPVRVGGVVVDKFIKSPLNYTGNKFRILSQIIEYFPKKIGTFVDLFCGGATVGFNIDAEKIILIDSNPRIINLLETLADNNIDKIINSIEHIIDEYNLSYSYKYGYSYYREEGYVEGNNGLKKYNDAGFYKLRDDYNSLENKSTFDANVMLYVLMVYGFNNDIRFNSEGRYNLPVGKTDFNKNNYLKLVDFNERAKKINFEFVLADFKSKEVADIINEGDFVYCDPPYLITTAVYNENNGWSVNDEEALLDILKKIDSNGKKFALSNILKKVDNENVILSNWIKSNNYVKHNIDYHYRSASYNKKNRNGQEEEVLITNEN